MDEALLTTASERIFLRKVTLADAEKIFLLGSLPQIMLYTGESPFRDIEAAQHFIQDILNRPQNQPTLYIAFRKDSGAWIGWAGFRYYTPGQTDISFRLLPEHWQQGFGTELVKTLLKIAQAQNISPLYAQVHPENQASIHLLSNNGFLPHERFPWQGKTWIKFQKI